MKKLEEMTSVLVEVALNIRSAVAKKNLYLTNLNFTKNGFILSGSNASIHQTPYCKAHS